MFAYAITVNKQLEMFIESLQKRLFQIQTIIRALITKMKIRPTMMYPTLNGVLIITTMYMANDCPKVL